MTYTAVDELQDIVKSGLVSDIFRMERAYFLHTEIGNQADILNARANGNFGELFGAVQQTMETEAALAVARVYDKPNPKYPTRCLRSALQLLEQRGGELPEIVESHNTKLALGFLAEYPDVIAAVDEGKSEFLLRFIPIFRSLLDRPEVTESVERLKYLRDKHIAHNETAEPGGPTWNALRELIRHAQNFVGVIGWAFYSTVYLHDGEYFLSGDAERKTA
jgi:hypothetical protein